MCGFLFFTVKEYSYVCCYVSLSSFKREDDDPGLLDCLADETPPPIP